MDDQIKLERWDADRWEEVAHINDLVYPPENPITQVWRQVDWSHAGQRVVVSVAGQPVCHVGLYLRHGAANGAPALIAGIGGVMTHPAHQKRRYATRALALTNDLAMKAGARFGFLVCEAKNIPFYQRLGWRVFDGTTMHQQHGTNRPWTLSPTMVRDIAGKAPEGGTIDLCGKPW